MKKILIPIDYHPSSEKVAEIGFELAQNMNAKVCLIHVIQDLQLYHMSHPGFSAYGGYQMIRNIHSLAEAQAVAEKILEKKTKGMNIDSCIHVAKGLPALSILTHAKDWEADLIVIGTHSQNIIEKILMGSVAKEVLSKAHIPVYMVPVKK